MIVSISGAYWITRGPPRRYPPRLALDQQIVEPGGLVAGEQQQRLGRPVAQRHPASRPAVTGGQRGHRALAQHGLARSSPSSSIGGRTRPTSMRPALTARSWSTVGRSRSSNPTAGSRARNRSTVPGTIENRAEPTKPIRSRPNLTRRRSAARWRPRLRPRRAGPRASRRNASPAGVSSTRRRVRTSRSNPARPRARGSAGSAGAARCAAARRRGGNAAPPRPPRSTEVDEAP